MSTEEFDISDLESKKMSGERLRGFPAYRYFKGGIAVAQTCTTCALVLGIDKFPVHGSRRVSSCSTCTRINRDNRRKGYANLSLDVVLSNRKSRYPSGKKKCNRCLEHKEFYEFYESKINTCWLAKECTSCLQEQLVSFPSSQPDAQRKLWSAKASRNKSRTDKELLESFNRLNPSGLKPCRSCKLETPFVGYNKNRTSYSGVQHNCKDCDSRLRSNRRKKTHVNYWTSLGIPIECYLCGGRFDDVEHIVPITLEGPDILKNTRPSCTECNRGIGGKHRSPMENYIYKVNHPHKTRYEIVEGLMLDGAWPFSVEYGSKKWEELEISKDPEFYHLWSTM